MCRTRVTVIIIAINTNIVRDNVEASVILSHIISFRFFITEQYFNFSQLNARARAPSSDDSR